MGNVRIHEDGSIYVKVIGFPSSDGRFFSESMWVKIESGDENEGVGQIWNDPVLSDLKFQDRVRFGGGSSYRRPVFLEKIDAA